jgi:NAD(P)-dependent dehydrogenase (short-subunit alcohol dehydrogenase family)
MLCQDLMVIPEHALILDTASKGAVLAMTRELAMVHAKEGIRVNALCP